MFTTVLISFILIFLPFQGIIAGHVDTPICTLVATSKMLYGDMLKPIDKSTIDKLHIRSSDPGVLEREPNKGHYYLQVDRVNGKDYPKYYMSRGYFENFFIKSIRENSIVLPYDQFILYFGDVYRYLSLLLTWDQFQEYYKQASKGKDMIPVVLHDGDSCGYGGPQFYLGERFEDKIPFLATPDQFQFFFAKTKGTFKMLLENGELLEYSERKTSHDRADSLAKDQEVLHSLELKLSAEEKRQGTQTSSPKTLTSFPLLSATSTGAFTPGEIPSENTLNQILETDKENLETEKKIMELDKQIANNTNSTWSEEFSRWLASLAENRTITATGLDMINKTVSPPAMTIVSITVQPTITNGIRLPTELVYLYSPIPSQLSNTLLATKAMSTIAQITSATSISTKFIATLPLTSSPLPNMAPTTDITRAAVQATSTTSTIAKEAIYTFFVSSSSSLLPAIKLSESVTSSSKIFSPNSTTTITSPLTSDPSISSFITSYTTNPVPEYSVVPFFNNTLAAALNSTGSQGNWTRRAIVTSGNVILLSGTRVSTL